ncbi:restriction endonuclease subunit S [Bacillus altitudinis]|uniref:restriction endonuclease subunit S n=1 Tax=Bacillus TaxID=1386 RepID=UPI002B2B16A7|nr:restriction endonuclease subunit S [Bacillus stratosphericus]
MDRKPPLSFNSEILWRPYKLGSLITKIETGTNDLGKENITDFPLLKMGNIQLGAFNLSKLEYLTKEQFNNSKKYIAKKGDFLFNTRNTLALVGKAATWTIDDKNYVFNSNIARISLDDSKIYSHFLNYLYATPSIWSQVKARAVGTTSVAAVYPRDLSSIKILIPDLKEQKKISMFFRQLDLRINLQQEKVDTFKEQKKGYIQKIFSQKLRFKNARGDSFPSWEEKYLKEISDVRDGTHDSPRYYPSGYPLVTSKNLNSNGTLNSNDLNYISKEDFEKVNKRSLVEDNDILFGMIGTIGNPVKVSNPNFAIKNVALIKDNAGKFNNYLIHFLNSSHIEKQFKLLLAGGTQKFIGLNDIRHLKVLVPCEEEQVQIAQFLSLLDKKISLEEKILNSYEQQKRAFMQQMFI